MHRPMQVGVDSTHPARKRKWHKKSRLGCANCKIRGIKCDEIKPSCRRCRSFGVCCLYGAKDSPDALSTQASFKVELVPSVVKSPSAPLPLSCSADGSESYQLVSQDMILIERFQGQTVLTLGSQSSRRDYVDNILPLAFSSPIVMHAVLALAEIHRLSFNASGVDLGNSDILHYHWHEAISSMHKKMSQPIVSSDRDALWITSSIISIGFFARPGSGTPAQASWPLRPPSGLDLAWVKLCDGKKLLWQLTKPSREDGLFHHSAKEIGVHLERMEEISSNGMVDLTCLPEGWYDLFELAHGRVNNRYYAAVVAITYLLSHELDAANFLPHLSFLSALDSDFRDLLRQRDEKAMLVLLYWYAKICDRRLWWMWEQSWREGLAMCEYLERRWARKPALFKLLVQPRMALTAASN